MASLTDAAGTTSYTYDGAGRLATVANPAAAVQLSYGYNSLSQVKTIGYGTNGNTRSFSYDGLHRLTTDELKNPVAAATRALSRPARSARDPRRRAGYRSGDDRHNFRKVVAS